MTIHAAGQSALAVGGMFPYDLSGSTERRYFSGIERCAVVAADEDLESRLRDRQFFRSNPDAIEEYDGHNRWYREHGPEHGITTVNTTELDPPDAADRVATWIRTRI